MGNDKRNSSVDVKSRLSKLCEDIGALDKKGINVHQAWKLYGKAINLKKQKGEENEILQYINQAEADLKRREVMCGWSTSWRVVIFCIALVVILSVGPAAFYIIWWYTHIELRVVLGVPISLIIWGYVGSSAYVLVSIGKRISQRLLDPQKFPEYCFRLILGAIFAAAIYYILLLGLLATPGTVSKEVNATLDMPPSEQIEQKEQNLDKLNDKKDKLNEEIDSLTVKIFNFSSRGVVEEGEQYAINEFKETLQRDKTELEEIDKVIKREEQKPIWESAIFVVVAFFSGFSVNFVNSIFNRTLRGILGIKEEDSQVGEGGVEKS